MQPVLIFEESRPSPWTSLSRLQLLTPSGQCGDSWGRGAGGCGGGGVGGQEAGWGGKRRGEVLRGRRRESVQGERLSDGALKSLEQSQVLNNTETNTF